LDKEVAQSYLEYFKLAEYLALKDSPDRSLTLEEKTVFEEKRPRHLLGVLEMDKVSRENGLERD